MEQQQTDSPRTAFVSRANSFQPQPDWPPVVVGSVFQTGLNLMRDLLSRGVRAVGVDNDPEHEGFRSSYGKSHLCPNPDTHPAEWVEFMKILSRTMGTRPVFIAAADIFVTAMGRHQAELREFYIFSPAAELQAKLTSKETQYELADRYGLPRPLTAYVQSSADLEAFVAKAQFPCLIKPLSQREWGTLPEGNPLREMKVAVADSADELRGRYALCDPRRANVIAQEIMQGPDSAKYCYFGVYAGDGSLLGNAVIQECRTHPMFFGMPSVVRPVVEKEIESMCNHFFQAVGYIGICEMELKRDTRDGKLKLIEVNARFTGSGDSASYMGVETGWLHYLDLIGQKPQPIRATRFDFQHICLKLDCMTVPRYLSAKAITWGEVIAPYRGKVEFYDFDWRDRRLALTTITRCLRYLSGGLLRHWRILS